MMPHTQWKMQLLQEGVRSPLIVCSCTGRVEVHLVGQVDQRSGCFLRLESEVGSRGATHYVGVRRQNRDIWVHGASAVIVLPLPKIQVDRLQLV